MLKEGRAVGSKLSRIKKVVIQREELSNDHPVNDKTFHGTWHPKRNLTIPGLRNQYATIVVTGMITGCGLGQIHGVTYLCLADKENFLKALEPVKTDGIGAIIATLGQDYWTNHEPTILELGFEKLAEYPNYKHGADGNYKQRNYILKL